jgi:ribosomal protein S18 acetylase RimI-like enzyme
MSDLCEITAVEAACFPPSVAATKKEFKERLLIYPRYFWLLEDNGKLIGFINGIVTNEPTIRDEMYVNVQLHNENGDWQTIFGLTTIPEYRMMGCATKLMKRVIFNTKMQGRKGCILTCEDKLIHYYEKFGYRNLGVSKSVIGDIAWNDMRLTF